MISERQVSGNAAVLAAAVLWGTVGPVQVLTGSSADPGALGAVRLLIGGTALMIPVAHRFPFMPLLRRPVLPWVLLAAVATAVCQATLLEAINRTGAALGTTVSLGFAPCATGVLAWWWLGDRPSRRWLIATATAILGTVLILAPGGADAVDPVGIACGVISGCCYSAYTVAAKIFLAAGLPQLVTVAPTFLLGGLLLTPFLATASPLTLLAPPTLLFLAWSGLIGTAAAYAAFTTGLRRTTAGTAATLTLAEPLTAAALGIVVLGEHLTLPALTGCLVLVIGLALVSLPGRRETDPEPLATAILPFPSPAEPTDIS